MTTSTRFSELLGVQHPIVCAGRNRVATPEMIAAVPGAGTIGFTPAHNFPAPEDLGKDMARTRDLTDQPFDADLDVGPVGIVVAG